MRSRSNSHGGPPDASANESESRRREAESLRVWIDRCIECELSRCEQGMTPDEWREHCDWIEEYARCCLWEALERRAARGVLRIKGTTCETPTT